jgi:predicted dinucleotide-binding enzyme
MQRKLQILFWIGIVLLFVPFFGIPETAKTILTIVIGMILIIISFKLKHAHKELKFRLRRYEEPSQTASSITNV